MSTADNSSADEDVKILHSMGYAQELSRRLGRFSNFAISFSIICILSGGINSLAQATSGGGGAAIGLGWPLGVFISGVFGLAMAQIASAFPTAGGLYHWGSILGNRFTRLAHGLVQPARPDYGIRRHQRRHLLFLHGHLRPDAAPDRLDDHADGVPDDPHGRTGADQSLRHFADGKAHRFLRLPDLRHCGAAGGGLPGLRAELRHLAAVDLQELLRRSRRQRLAERVERLDIPAGPADADLHHHRLRRVGAHLRRNQERGAVLAARHRVLDHLVGCVRLPVPGRLRADDSEHGRRRQAGLERVLLGDGPARALHHEGDPLPADLRFAGTVRAGHGYFGLADDLRLLARRWTAGVEDAGEGFAFTPHAERGDLDQRDPRAAVRLGRASGSRPVARRCTRWSCPAP